MLVYSPHLRTGCRSWIGSCLGVSLARRFSCSMSLSILLIWRRLWPGGRISWNVMRQIGISYSLRMILRIVCATTLSHVPYGSRYCVPEQRSSIEDDPARLTLLVIGLFGATPEMIALPPTDNIFVLCSFWQVSFGSACRYTIRPFCKIRVHAAIENGSIYHQFALLDFCSIVVE